ncbi:MAG: phage minor head protein [Clostridia bacterium]
MSDYTEAEELAFIQSLYDEANKQLKEVYKDQKDNRDELLKEIAVIMLAYTILDSLMSLPKQDIKKEYSRLSKIIDKSAQGQGTTENNVIKDILTDTVNKTFDFYSYNVNLKDVKKIIENNFKGKYFSSRVWDNEEEVAKHLHKQVNDFLNGKVNVNQIKKNIEKTYNTNAYNAKRLVETEVSRCSNDAFNRFCKETGVEKLRYNATLENTCAECLESHGKEYEYGDEPSLPRHPLCHCFYEIIE